MFGTMRHKVQIWSVIISGFACLAGCTSIETEESNKLAHHFRVETQGTTYEIIVADSVVNFTNQEIDSVLAQFDASLSTYIPSSKISQLNAGQGSIRIVDSSGYFKSCYLNSQDIFSNTSGAFDPSVFPLVRMGIYGQS